MFSDRATIYVQAGKGGDGSVAFRREKYVPKGGPSGGDGGPGGDVVFVADAGRRDLTRLRFNPHVRAPDGRPGEGSNRSGSTGRNTVVAVPVGTQIFGEDGALLCDLAHAGASVVIARGGRGGAGNRHFATATRRAPRIAGVGEEGEFRTLEARLKLPADAALLGFPNVGKSSLLRRLSNATPKVADYPFTTIEPGLGTVDGPGARQVTVIDVPGLLEGASEGVGLGLEFLAHLERARLLLHILRADDAWADLAAERARFAAIHGELRQHGHGLAERPRIVVLNRIDLVPDAEHEALRRAFATEIETHPGEADAAVVRGAGHPIVIATSCVTGEGIDDLKATLFDLIPEAAPLVPGEEDLADYLVYRPGRGEVPRFRIMRGEGGLRVVCEELELLAAAVESGSAGAVAELHAVLVSSGVLRALKKAGARPGAVVAIGAAELEFSDPEADER